jgi:hypothetical protein
MSAAPLRAGPHTNRRAAWSCDRRPHGRRGDLPHRRMDMQREAPDSLGNCGSGLMLVERGLILPLTILTDIYVHASIGRISGAGSRPQLAFPIPAKTPAKDNRRK